jgi:AcrR family transcriptional regulator
MSPGRASGVESPHKSSNYHSPLRQRQAAATRDAIVAAAVTLFTEQGWAATTLPMVAAEAGTAVDTIYSVFGSKSGLLLAAIDVATPGDDNPLPMADRPELAEFGVGTMIERLRMGVGFALDVYERSVGILRALLEAAASDEPARARLELYDEQRREVLVVSLQAILGRPAPDVLVDGLWALVSPEVFTMLTDRRGWTREEAENWFVEQSAAAVKSLSGSGLEVDEPPGFGAATDRASGSG